MSIEALTSSPLVEAAESQGAAQKDSPAKIQRAASEFESFLVAEMLKSAREASEGGWTGDGEDNDANSTMIELGEQQFAQALASSGGLGIAKMVISGLNKYADR